MKLQRQFCYVHLIRDVKKLELEFPEDEEIAKFANDLNDLLAEAVGLRNEYLSLNEYRKKARELKNQMTTVMHTAKCRGRDPAEFMEEVLDIFAQDKSADISHLLIPEKTQKDKSVA